MEGVSSSYHEEEEGEETAHKVADSDPRRPSPQHLRCTRQIKRKSTT